MQLVTTGARVHKGIRKCITGSVKKHIENYVFLVFEVPQFLSCDNGKQYVSKSLKSIIWDQNSSWIELSSVV